MDFLAKYEQLKKSIPTASVIVAPTVENCEMVDVAHESKNCYFSFDIFLLENSMYCTLCHGKNLVDCYYGVECELCYQCIQSNKCHNSTYLSDCANCRDCHYSIFLQSCSDCFGCVALSHKQYCIFNKQYTKEEYFEKVQKLRKEDPLEILKKVQTLKKTIPHPASQQGDNVSCLYGDYMFYSKSSYWCFSAYWMENCGFIYDTARDKNCFDLSHSSRNEQCYEMVDSRSNYDSMYLQNSDNNTNCYYSKDLRNCSACFGCVALTNKKYCILNNQLTREQYTEIVAQIRKELRWKV